MSVDGEHFKNGTFRNRRRSATSWLSHDFIARVFLDHKSNMADDEVIVFLLSMISSLIVCLELNIALHNMYERNQRPSKFCSRLWHSTTIPPRHQTMESVRFCFFLRSVPLTGDMLGKVKKWLHLSRKQQRNVNNAETFLRRIRKLVSTFPWRNKAAISSKIAGFMELENSCPIAIAFTCMTTTRAKVPHYESDFFPLFLFLFL